MKNDFHTNLNNYKRESDEKMYSYRHDLDDAQKALKTNYYDEFMKFKDEVRNKLDSSEMKIQKDFSKVIDDTTQAIEDSINQNIIVQMKEMD